MEPVDVEDDMSSFGSQMTDEGSVVFICEAADFSSDDDIVEEENQSEKDESGRMI